MSFEDLISQAHSDINEFREKRGLNHWNFKEARMANLSDDRCKMCADAGFPDILAHYKAVPKGMSHDGKGKPALCWDHAHGKIPRHILESRPQQAEPEPKAEPGLTNQTKSEVEKCGCGRPLPHKGRCAFRRGENGNSRALAPTAAKPVRGKRAKSLSDVLLDLRVGLQMYIAEQQRNVEAVERVIQLVERANAANSAAEFFEAG